MLRIAVITHGLLDWKESKISLSETPRSDGLLIETNRIAPRKNRGVPQLCLLNEGPILCMQNPTERRTKEAQIRME